MGHWSNQLSLNFSVFYSILLHEQALLAESFNFYWHNQIQCYAYHTSFLSHGVFLCIIFTRRMIKLNTEVENYFLEFKMNNDSK